MGNDDGSEVSTSPLSLDSSSLFDDVTNSDGTVRSLTAIAKQGFGSWLLAVAAAGIAGMEAVFNLIVIVPAQALQDVATGAVEAIFLAPLGIVTSGADASSTGAGEFGVFGLIVGLGVVLLGFLLVNRFLEFEMTSDAIPGLSSDVIPFFGADEEEE